jgi:hypothetical protein
MTHGRMDSSIRPCDARAQLPITSAALFAALVRAAATPRLSLAA